MEYFVEQLEVYEGVDFQKKVIQDFYMCLCDPTKVQFLAQFPTHKSADGLGNLDKALALKVAEALGPTRAQELYHFIVLVTKLA